MNIRFRSTELSFAEVSFLKWQYGFDEEDDPFERALWQVILRAWEADNALSASSRYLERLGCRGAFPDEVGLYVRFKSEGSDKVWDELIHRAGLSDRRTARADTAIDRRRAASRA